MVRKLLNFIRRDTNLKMKIISKTEREDGVREKDKETGRKGEGTEGWEKKDEMRQMG